MGERDLEAERRACVNAEGLAVRARALLEQAAADLDLVGLFGIGGVAREAIRKTEKLRKRATVRP